MLAALALAWTSGCASQGAPPGGPVDRRPPVLIATEPDTFATLADLNASVRFFFDERISENVSGGDLEDAIVVSPRSGPVRVGHGRTSLTVSVEGGFRPGLVYRVTLLPTVRDMFGNQLRDPFELVFSTGGEAPPTALAGQVWSRISGRPTAGALVQAVGADSLVYLARSDQEGIYAFRYLPEGAYQITAFEDTDRDGSLDAREPQGTVSSALAYGDTLLVDVPTLPNDTTEAVAVSATALDSVTVAIEFDDYLEVASPVADVVVELERDEGSAPRVARLFHEPEYGAYVDQITDSLARLDSLEAAARAAAAPAPTDSLAGVDSPGAAAQAEVVEPAADSTAAGVGAVAPGAGAGASRPRARPVPPRLERGGPRGPAQQRPLPTRRMVGVLDSPLEVDTEYRVRVTGVVNINLVAGGGGEVELELRGREAPSAAPQPSGGAPNGAPTGPGASPSAGPAAAPPVDADTTRVNR